MDFSKKNQSNRGCMVSIAISFTGIVGQFAGQIPTVLVAINRCQKHFQSRLQINRQQGGRATLWYCCNATLHDTSILCVTVP